jgi:hypothetical protein
VIQGVYELLLVQLQSNLRNKDTYRSSLFIISKGKLSFFNFLILFSVFLVPLTFYVCILLYFYFGISDPHLIHLNLYYDHHISLQQFTYITTNFSIALQQKKLLILSLHNPIQNFRFFTNRSYAFLCN